MEKKTPFLESGLKEAKDLSIRISALNFTANYRSK